MYTLKLLFIILFISICVLVTADTTDEDAISVLASTNVSSYLNSSESIENRFEEFEPGTVITTSDSNSPVFRYHHTSLPYQLQDSIESIEFRNGSTGKGGVIIQFSLPDQDASLHKSYYLADFIVSRNEWTGDRSRDSVAAEIYINWLAENAKLLFNASEQYSNQNNPDDGENLQYRQSPIHPLYLGYYYHELTDSDPLESFIKKI